MVPQVVTVWGCAPQEAASMPHAENASHHLTTGVIQNVTTHQGKGNNGIPMIQALPLSVEGVGTRA